MSHMAGAGLGVSPEPHASIRCHSFPPLTSIAFFRAMLRTSVGMLRLGRAMISRSWSTGSLGWRTAWEDLDDAARVKDPLAGQTFDLGIEVRGQLDRAFAVE